MDSIFTVRCANIAIKEFSEKLKEIASSDEIKEFINNYNDVLSL